MEFLISRSFEPFFWVQYWVDFLLQVVLEALRYKNFHSCVKLKHISPAIEFDDSGPFRYAAGYCGIFQF